MKITITGTHQDAGRFVKTLCEEAGGILDKYPEPKAAFTQIVKKDGLYD